MKEFVELIMTEVGKPVSKRVLGFNLVFSLSPIVATILWSANENEEMESRDRVPSNRRPFRTEWYATTVVMLLISAPSPNFL